MFPTSQLVMKAPNFRSGVLEEFRLLLAYNKRTGRISRDTEMSENEKNDGRRSRGEDEEKEREGKRPDLTRSLASFDKPREKFGDSHVGVSRF